MDEKEMEQKMNDGLKMVCMLSKMAKKRTLKDLNDLDVTMKLSTMLALSDRDKALKICDAGHELERAKKNLIESLDKVTEILKEVSNLTEADEARLHGDCIRSNLKSKTELSDKDNDMLNKLFGDE